MAETSTPALPSGPFLGRETFRTLVRDALATAAAQGWPELILCDADFKDWPLGERACVAALNDWAPRARGLIMLAGQYNDVVREHARFVEWRRVWSHKIDCRECKVTDPQELPSALWSAGWVLQRMDVRLSHGVSGAEVERRVWLREAIDNWLKRSAAGFPATTLGL